MDKNRNPGNGQGNGRGNGMLAAFFPGQKAALAEQLNQGFGGGEGQWRGMMNKTYGPIRNAANFRYSGGGMGNGGNNHGGNPTNHPTPTPTPGGWSPGSPIGQASLSPEMLALIRDKLTRQGM